MKRLLLISGVLVTTAATAIGVALAQDSPAPPVQEHQTAAPPAADTSAPAAEPATALVATDQQATVPQAEPSPQPTSATSEATADLAPAAPVALDHHAVMPARTVQTRHTNRYGLVYSCTYTWSDGSTETNDLAISAGDGSGVFDPGSCPEWTL